LIQKAIFDVRNDSDALYSHFDLSVAGIQDIQLMEVARRPSFKKYLSSLSKCIGKDGKLSTDEQQAWLAVKDKGRGLFAPEFGGSYKVFNQRPLSKDIQSYCVQDVQYLARLWKIYDAQLTSYWRKQVEDATTNRILLSQSKHFNGKGRHMAISPF
jgi:exonuclease 3'-5' domain-containing protein 1